MKKIYVVSCDVGTNTKLYKQIKELTDSKVEVIGKPADLSPKIDFNDGLVVITSPFIYHYVKHKLDSWA